MRASKYTASRRILVLRLSHILTKALRGWCGVIPERQCQ